MIARRILRTFSTLLLVGFLASGTCQVKVCSGDCKNHDHDHENEQHASADRFTSFRFQHTGAPPGDSTRILRRIEGPRLLPEERADRELRGAFLRRVLEANRDHVGLGPFAHFPGSAEEEASGLVLRARVRDALGAARVALWIDADGALTELVLERSAPWRPIRTR